jgi:rare lipoprotein A
MRYLFASFWLALLLCAGISLPATAQTSGRVYGGGHGQWTDGTIYWHGQGAQRRRLARTHSDDGDYRASRRYRGYDADEDRTYRRRYAKKRSHTRTARRHQQRTVRRDAKKHKLVQQRRKPAVQRHHASAHPVAPAPAPKASLGSDGQKAAGARGIASYYWQPQRVASGGWFNPNGMTAAHKTLPFGTRVRVTHLGNGRTVEVKINDRGPYVAGRIIDLSKAAASVLGMTAQGVARVAVEVLGR